VVLLQVGCTLKGLDEDIDLGRELEYTDPQERWIDPDVVEDGAIGEEARRPRRQSEQQPWLAIPRGFSRSINPRRRHLFPTLLCHFAGLLGFVDPDHVDFWVDTTTQVRVMLRCIQDASAVPTSRRLFAVTFGSENCTHVLGWLVRRGNGLLLSATFLAKYSSCWAIRIVGMGVQTVRTR
jgi:hypothetical protein